MDLLFSMLNLTVAGSDAQHKQQNTLVPVTPYGSLSVGLHKLRSILLITENDLVVCLSKAHGISMVPLIEYLICP